MQIALQQLLLTLTRACCRGTRPQDKCAWSYGSLGSYGGGYYNVLDANNNPWLIQKNWNPVTGSCVISA